MLKRLAISRKLALLCSSFFLPIGFLAYLFIAQTQKDVTFAEKELAGSAYLLPLRTALAAAVDLSRKAAAPTDLARAMEQVARLEAQLGAAMESADIATASAAAARIAQAHPPGSPPAAYAEVIAALMAHITKVQDASNLTLDPDLDSYYVQDLVAVKLPAFTIATAQVLDAALALRAPAPAGSDTAALVHFLTSKGAFAAALSGLEGDVAAAIKGNSDGSVKAALNAAQTEFSARAAAFSRLLDALSADSPESRPTAEALRAAERAAQDGARRLWDVAFVDLDRLLIARIDGFNAKLYLSLGLTGLVLIAALALAWGIGRSITGPLQRLHGTMETLAAGTTDIMVPETGRGDELGVMARSVEVFRDGLIRARDLAAAQLAEQVAKTERAQRIAGLLGDFDGMISTALTKLSTVAREVEQQAQVMTRIADAAAANAQSVGEDSHAMLDDVQAVASAAEELAAAIAEVNHQMGAATDVTSRAQSEAGSVTALVTTLSGEMDRVGEVVKLIETIAAQTNLLALNATIEAARAGEAGKGFAIVAGEVKNLAGQTAAATQQINQQIGTIQASTERVVAAIETVSDVISQMGGIVTAIVAAVEEQSATTSEIARSAALAATRTAGVAHSVTSVGTTAAESRESGRLVFNSAGQMALTVGDLRQQVDRFLVGLRA